MSKKQSKTKIKNKKDKKKFTAKNKQFGMGGLDHRAEEIDAICRRKLPDDAIRGGVLAGRESEIRQDALIMALQGFIEGNPRYAKAVATNNANAAALEVEKSVSIALRKCKLRLATKLTTQDAGHVRITEHNGGCCQHPSCQAASDWPLAVKIEIVMRGMDQAVSTGKLSAANAGVVAIIAKDRKSVEEAAEILGVSRGAVYQQLDRVREVLPGVIERMEPPSLPGLRRAEWGGQARSLLTKSSSPPAYSFPWPAPRLTSPGPPPSVSVLIQTMNK